MPNPPHSQFEAAWRYRFEEYAAIRDDDAGIAGWSSSGLESRMRRFIALWPGGKPGERWLDAGCGAGSYSRLLLERGVEVVGIDYSLPTIFKARERSGEKGSYAVADVRRLPFPPGSFDGVLCFGVMQALADVLPALRELAGQSCASGQVWVDALNRWCLRYLWDGFKRKVTGRPMHLRYDSPWNIKRSLHECGLVNITLHWMPILPGRLQRFQPAFEGRAAQWLFRYVPLLGLVLCHAFIVCAEKPAVPAMHTQR